MSNFQKPITPPRVSFGVELEFFVAYVREGEPDPDEGIKDQLQPLVVVPEDEYETTAWVYGKIRGALAEAGLPVHNAKEHVVPGSVQESHGQKIMSSFRIVSDVSLKADKIDGYRFQSVEMTSPAMYDMKLSFDMIRLAFAALLWAADPLISRLHSPWRAITCYSQSGRVNQMTALGEDRGPADVLIDRLTTNTSSSARGDLSPKELKRVKCFGRDRLLGESVEPDLSPEAMQREIDLDQEDDMALLQGEPWRHQAVVPEVTEAKSSGDPDGSFGFPAVNYKAPVPRPKQYHDPASDKFAPPRPRPPPISRLYPRVPGTMREDTRNEPGFLEGHLVSHGGNVQDPEPRVPPRRWDVMSGVRDLLGADMTAAQIGELMRHRFIPKHINYKFDGYSLHAVRDQKPKGGDTPPRTGMWINSRNTKMNTVEFREAAGTLDAEWVATWARICCRLLEWSRDAAPAEYMAVIRLLAWAQEEEGANYDVIDFLVDLGLLTEARFCEKRLAKGEAAWWECLNIGQRKGWDEDIWWDEGGYYEDEDEDEGNGYIALDDDYEGSVYDLEAQTGRLVPVDAAGGSGGAASGSENDFGDEEQGESAV
ncbi:hypothetical protein EsH8_VI_000485 [Colletotrichum jinshuiense]